MKKIIVMAALIILVAAAVFAETTTTFRAELPVLITSAGQNPDGSTVAALLKRAKIKDYDDVPAILAKDVDWNKFNTIIIVIGGSGKGLGSAGISTEEDIDRVNALVAACKEHGKKIITMHIGGQDRRGANSVPFLPFAAVGDLMIVNSNGNADGYFTKLANDNKIPFIEVAKNTELGTLLGTIFGK